MGVSLNNSLCGRGKPARPMMSEINVTPFVDVMLVLLVIFMVTAPLLTAGVQVDLPEEDAPPLPGQDEPLSISINKKGKIYIQDKKISLNNLVPKLEAIAKRGKDTRIFLRGDSSIDYGVVMKVMTAINAAGYTKVGLVTEQPDDKRR